MQVGISALSFDLPKIHLPIKDLAIARNIEPEKLEKGLGLIRMTMADVHQDAVVFAANAVLKLIKTENLLPKDIHRIYVGTESGVDASKPIASFLLSILESQYGENTFEHCDAVDFTFACISGVDALQTSLDFVRIHPDKKAIVICTDIAKYDLESTGEYTQGAGAVAMLIGKNPAIISFDTHFGISTKGVFDFFKPRRIYSKSELQLQNHIDFKENEIEIFKEQPVFDGQYSNQCYVDRTKNAYISLKNQLQKKSLYSDWKAVNMHLPYAFQARRMFVDLYILDDENLLKEFDKAVDKVLFTKEISKSEAYIKFVDEKIKPSELASSLIGNMYTASIFMGFLSTLCYFYKQNENIDNATFGFLAYGSGSKSKVFEGKIQSNWKEKIQSQKLFEELENSLPISIEQYTMLHIKSISESICKPKNECILHSIENEKPNLLGARYYSFIE